MGKKNVNSKSSFGAGDANMYLVLLLIFMRQMLTSQYLVLLLIFMRQEMLTSQYLVLLLIFMVLNATLNNISAIAWQSVLLEKTGVPGENQTCHKSRTEFTT